MTRTILKIKNLKSFALLERLTAIQKCMKDNMNFTWTHGGLNLGPVEHETKIITIRPI